LVFQRADVILVNKMDLLPFTDFDVARVQKDIGLINPKTKIFFVSARNGDGLEEWSSWLLEQIHAKGRTKLM